MQSEGRTSGLPCDLLSENFIDQPGGKMWVIDWEYGGKTVTRTSTSGDFCVELPVSGGRGTPPHLAVLGASTIALTRADDALDRRHLWWCFWA